MKYHLAIFSKKGFEQLLSGQKTIETRFSVNRIAPFGQVGVGDLVYIKVTGEDIYGQFYIKKVVFFEGVSREDIELIKALIKDNDEIKIKKSTRYATLIWIDRLERFITSPIKVPKRDQRGWVVLEESKLSKDLSV